MMIVKKMEVWSHIDKEGIVMTYRISIPVNVINMVSVIDNSLDLPRDKEKMEPILIGRLKKMPDSVFENFFNGSDTTQEYHVSDRNNYYFLMESVYSVTETRDMIRKLILDFCDNAEDMVSKSFNKFSTAMGSMILRLLITSVPIGVELNG
jgi:hypothetical protein